MMEIKVNKQPQRFYLAVDGWVPAVGHEIRVGEYRFCAIPNEDVLNISEVTSGMKIHNIPVNHSVLAHTETKEKAMQYFRGLGEKLKRLIEQEQNFDERLEKARKLTEEQFGEMPPIYTVDVDWVLEHNDVVH